MTDADVKRLVALIDEGHYHDSAIHPGSMARHLLAAGVQLPPVPEPEAGPQYIAARNASTDMWHISLLDGGMGRDLAMSRSQVDAERIVDLLRLDAKYEDGIEAEVERLRSGILDSTGEVAAAEARRDEARERAEKAERELAEARAAVDACRSVIATLVQRYGVSPEAPEWANRETSQMLAALSADAASPTDAPEPIECYECETYGRNCLAHPGDPSPDDATGRRVTAAEPLFTGIAVGTQFEEGEPVVTVRLRSGVRPMTGDEVEVWRAGVRPAAPTVTAEMVLATVVKNPWIEAKRPMDWTVEEVHQVVNGLNAQLCALNRLLAEQGGEG